jgi:hypothetical protein
MPSGHPEVSVVITYSNILTNLLHVDLLPLCIP